MNKALIGVIVSAAFAIFDAVSGVKEVAKAVKHK